MFKVSVIIPCFNSEHYIENCLRSVLNQTYQSFEIICVDNNSSDRTLEKLKEISQSKNIIITTEGKQNSGAARNKGLALAKGEWIQFLDSDDILYPDKLERQLSLIKNNTKLIVGAYDISINNLKPEKFEIQQSNNWSLLINSGLGNTCSNLWNAQLLKDIGGWNENYSSSQEYELMFRILKKISSDEIVEDNISSMLYNRRISNSISNNYKNNTIVRIELRKTFKDYFLKSTLSNKNALINETHNFMFNDIRFLSTMDSNKAIEMYQLCIDNDFVPMASFVTPWYYILCYRVFGFKFTEKLFSLKRKIVFKEKQHHF